MKTVGSYEAKTHLPRLLDEVAGGETIIITKHGVPVATLAPVRADRADAAAAAIELRAFGARHPLRGLKIRDLIDEGRRR
jgi:prevent-host-death family protein